MKITFREGFRIFFKAINTYRFQGIVCAGLFFICLKWGLMSYALGSRLALTWLILMVLSLLMAALTLSLDFERLKHGNAGLQG